MSIKETGKRLIDGDPIVNFGALSGMVAGGFAGGSVMNALDQDPSITSTNNQTTTSTTQNEAITPYTEYPQTAIAVVAGAVAVGAVGAYISQKLKALRQSPKIAEAAIPRQIQQSIRSKS